MDLEDTKQDVAIASIATKVEDLQGQIDRRFGTVDKQLDLLLTNHIPHLQKDISKLKVQMALYAGGIGVGVWVLDKLIAK